MKSLCLPVIGLLVLIAFSAGCASQSSRTEGKAEPKPATARLDFDELIKAGRDKMGVGDFDAALSFFEQAVAQDATQPTAFLHRGYARKEKGDIDGALADLGRIPDGDVNYVFVYVTRGATKHAKGDFRGAAFDFGQAAFLAPYNAQVFVSLAVAKKSVGDFDGAIADASRALALDPRLGTAYAARGLARHHRGDRAGALADFDQLVAMSPRDTAAWYNRGMIKMHGGDLDGALADYAQAIATYPNNSFAYNGIARAKASVGDLAGAQEAYLTSIAVEPWRATYNRFELALIFRRQHLDESPAGLASAVDAWSAGWTKTIGSFLLGRISEGELFAKADEGAPHARREHRCEASYYAGMTHLLKNDRDGARRLFEQCVGTNLTGFGEYLAATKELQRLGDGRATGQSPR